MPDMILRTTLTSPFGRKPRLAAAVVGLADRMEVVAADILDDNDSLRAQNPLGKIPTLVLGDGSTLYDSRVILEYFDYLAGGNRIIPAEPVARFAALKLQAIGDGILDAGVLRRLETIFRDEPLWSQRWLGYQCGKMNRALDVLEEAPPSETAILVGEIAVACSLGFIDFRLGDDWRAGRPRLAGWFERFGARCPGFVETAPR
jgi:glutathione S-transferase